MYKRVSLIALILFMHPACALITSNADSSALMMSAPNQVIGHINGKAIHRRDLLSEDRRRLADAENEIQIRTLELLWAGLEEKYTQVLLADLAKKKQISVSSLLENAYKRNAIQPSESEIQRAFTASRLADVIPYADARPMIERELTEQNKRISRLGLTQELRSKAKITYDLPMPHFRRFDIAEGLAPSIGPKNAPVHLVVFLDFLCSYCKEGDSLLTELAKRYPQDLRISIKGYPLPNKTLSRELAEAGHCAHEQGKYWSFHQRVFLRRDRMPAQAIPALVGEAGLEAEQFNACIASGRASMAISENITQAQRNGVTGVPAMFVNGIRLNGVIPLPLMEKIVDHEFGQL